MKISDEQMKVSLAFPAQNTNANTAEVDLGADRVGAVGANLDVQIVVPVTPILVDGQTLTFTFEDSAVSGSGFAAVETTGNMVVTGVNSPGGDAKTFSFFLPRQTRRFVRVNVAVSATAGDNTNESFSLEFKV